ncbi:MAG: TonB-dependent receptor [Sphingomonas sp.]|nr:MAG: TonB-dependent receptor [Sphingomonas sp.]
MAGAAAAVMMVSASPAMAQTRTFNVPAQSASRSIPIFAKQAGVQIIASGSTVQSKRTNQVRGNFSVEEALRRLLEGTGLVASRVGSNGIITIQAAPMGEAIAGGAAANSEGAEIVVTGTRVEGGETASPTTVLRTDQIRMAGQTNAGEAMRALPQNFSGGQNPGVTAGAIGITNQNLNSGSSPNLRGLGADATLTLLNGHRLSFGSFVQAVDVSAIPLAAIDRIEVVPDGASAVYGSDAVAGVVNVILKQNYNGLSLLTNVGGATDGGDFKQQYSAVAGRTWSTGGIMAAFSHDENSAIFSNQREFTKYMPAGNTLYPKINQNSLVVSGRQNISSSIEAYLDATYNVRTAFSSQATSSGYVYTNTPTTRDFSVSPSVRLSLGSKWDLRVSGTYARSKTEYDQTTFYNGAASARTRGCYCNVLGGVEAYASGPLATINGNTLDLVAGGGYRYNHYETVRYTTSATDNDGSISSFYAFSEISVPFVKPGQGSPLLEKLIVNAALRYERYPQIASVAVPKIGMIYGISPSVEIKATWGKSFKAPMLYYKFADRLAYLYPVSYFGGEQRFNNGSILLVDVGGNTNLKPEKATSWSTTLSVHPVSIPRLNLQATYFHVNYKDRIVQPVPGAASSSVLSGSSPYDSFITYDPSQSVVDEILAGADNTYNYGGTGAENNIVAILNNRYVNAARQNIHGIDISMNYRFLLDSSSILINSNGSWLWSNQKISESLPVTPLAGTIFNPPRFKARASLGWANDALSLMTYVNHMSGLEDNRSTPSVRIDSQTTFDASIRYNTQNHDGPLQNVSIIVSAQNIFNKRPPYAKPTSGQSYYVNYDSTNYSSIGRFVSVTISKDW